MGSVSTNVYTKFRCAPPRIKKALGIFGPGRTDNKKKKKNRMAFWDPPSGSKNTIVRIVRKTQRAYLAS